MKIKVKLFDEKCKFEVIKKGDWIDLRSRYDMEYTAPYADRLTQKKTVRKVHFEKMMVPLGIAMQLPVWLEAWILPRGCSFKNYGFIQGNSEGIVDDSYRGKNDEWWLPIIPLKDGKINAGDRVCQFRVALNQKATWWQKLKWLFTKIEFEFVKDFEEGTDRGSEGSTGVK